MSNPDKVLRFASN